MHDNVKLFYLAKEVSSGLDVKSFFFESKFWIPLIVTDKAHRTWRHNDLKDRGNIGKMSTEVEMAKIRPDRGGVRVGTLPARCQGELTPLSRLRHKGTGHPSEPPSLLQHRFNFRSGWKQSLFLLKTFILVDDEPIPSHLATLSTTIPSHFRFQPSEKRQKQNKTKTDEQTKKTKRKKMNSVQVFKPRFSDPFPGQPSASCLF